MSYEISNPKEAAKKIKELAGPIFQWGANDIQVRIRKFPFKITMQAFSCQNAKHLVAEFTLEQQPNCCGAVVSTNTFVDPSFRGQKIAQAMMPLKEEIAREFGYSMLLATVNVTDNPAEVHILKKFGWQEAFNFNNDRTTNNIGFFFKPLIVSKGGI